MEFLISGARRKLHWFLFSFYRKKNMKFKYFRKRRDHCDDIFKAQQDNNCIWTADVWAAKNCTCFNEWA